MKNKVITISLAVMLVLGVSLIGCGGEPVPEITKYNLTILSSTGGSVEVPGEGTFRYDEGTVVSLVAVPSSGHTLVNWVGDVDTIPDIHEATTNITMDGNYLIIASFAMEIWDWHDLHAARNATSSRCLLMNNLDSSTSGYAELASETANDGQGWQPIGTAHIYPDEPYIPFDPFTGSFDGQGHEIKDMSINRPGENGVGVFGFLDGGGAVQNLAVVNAHVTAEGYVGGLVGWNHMGTVTNCCFSGSVTGGWGVGGLVGANRGTVSHSNCSGNITGGWGVGGLTGDSFGGALIDSYFAGSVTGDEIGGLVGWNAPGTVSDSHYNYHEVLLNGQNIITIGALPGEDFDRWLADGRFLDVNQRLSQEDGYYIISNARDFRELLSFGQKSSLRFRLESDLDLANEPDFYIPYLAGEFDGNGHRILNLSSGSGFISQVGAFGYIGTSGKLTRVGVENVTMVGNRFVGGLVGANHGGTVSESYATGSVTGRAWYVGGLVGQNRGAVSNCYSGSSVSGEMWVGGLVGDSWGSVSNSFWDIEGSGQATSAGGTGKTTTEMKSIATFAGAGWNIVTVANPSTRNPAYIWNIVDAQTYPFLSWQA